jgi:hypothetical protein
VLTGPIGILGCDYILAIAQFHFNFTKPTPLFHFSKDALHWPLINNLFAENSRIYILYTLLHNDVNLILANNLWIASLPLIIFLCWIVVLSVSNIYPES